MTDLPPELDALRAQVSEMNVIAEQLSDAMDEQQDMIISMTQELWDLFARMDEKTVGDMPSTVILGGVIQIMLNVCQQLAQANVSDPNDAEHVDATMLMYAQGLAMLIVSMADNNNKISPGSKQ